MLVLALRISTVVMISIKVHYLHPLKPSTGQGMDHNLSQWIV